MKKTRTSSQKSHAGRPGELTIGIDLGDVWSHYCTRNEEGEVVDRGRFRTTREVVYRSACGMGRRGSRCSLDL